jgi:hypothetical protein
MVRCRDLPILMGALGWLAGCSGAAPDAAQRRATNLNPSGRPYTGPQLYQPQSRGNANGAFNPLYCHPEDAGTVCTRQPR